MNSGGRILMPSFEGHALSDDMHYEVELVFLVGSSTDGCSIMEAPAVIKGIGVGLDMTLRDVQFEDRKKGHPWLKSKGFRKSALISDFLSCTPEILASNPEISLELNGRRVQEGRMGEMIHGAEELIHYLSYLYGLRRHDLIFTGTPAGVGSVSTGDRLSARLSLPGSGNNAAQEIRLEATVE
ncbi:MAG: fumarylacetoacetate hydrolase family protein [Chlorobium sp.]|nr:fumarylacetoacetate hydrolase family protein [Chlorobium sp.]